VGIGIDDYSDGSRERRPCTQYLYSVHLSLSLSLLEVGSEGTRKIYEAGIVEFWVQQTRDGHGPSLIEFQLYSDIAVLGVRRMTLRRAPGRCKAKE